MSNYDDLKDLVEILEKLLSLEERSTNSREYEKLSKVVDRLYFLIKTYLQ